MKITSEKSFSKISILCLILIFLAVCLNLYSYRSIISIFAGIIYWFFGRIMVSLIGQTIYEKKIYNVSYIFCYFMSGIAAYYANILNDPMQTSSDAYNFYWISTLDFPVSIIDIMSTSEGFGAIVIWRALYNFFSSLGFQDFPFFGILLNVLFIALSGVFLSKVVSLTFSVVKKQQERLVILYSFCGILWLFSSLHLRDAFILFEVNILLYFWIRFLTKCSIFNIVLLSIFSFLGFISLGTLRTEFVFVPAAMLIAGIMAHTFFRGEFNKKRLKVYLIIMGGVVVVALIILNMAQSLFDALYSGYEGYKTIAQDTGGNSLANKFIVAAPLPIRLILGSIYLFIFPIPVWQGFQLESAYHLFKSFNALYFYFLTPLFGVSVFQILKNVKLRRPAVMFLLFIVVGFTLAIAGTSLEIRHFGTFVTPIIAVSVIPSINPCSGKQGYRIALVGFLVSMTILHTLWFCVKFL